MTTGNKSRAKAKTKKVTPITPNEVTKKKSAAIPSAVIEIFNQLITENWDGHSAHIEQDKACERVCKALNITRDQVFDRGYLDVEDIFSEYGWDVEYDKPGYNENYEPFFVFSK